VRKTTLQYDEATLKAAERALGTSGLKATVDAAFEAAIRQAAWLELVARHEAGAIDLTNEEVEDMGMRDLGDAAGGRA
jgi:Arc/MetJ family transcription regulator